jgi:hypothetical protein
MIEIIKKGVPYEQRFMKVECKFCLSVLRFQGNEVVEGVDIKWIICPVCGKNVNVASAQNLS